MSDLTGISNGKSACGKGFPGGAARFLADDGQPEIVGSNSEAVFRYSLCSRLKKEAISYTW